MFAANPGGAPCNVLAMLQKLGRKPLLLEMWAILSRPLKLQIDTEGDRIPACKD